MHFCRFAAGITDWHDHSSKQSWYQQSMMIMVLIKNEKKALGID
jgi:hypothetical protein